MFESLDLYALCEDLDGRGGVYYGRSGPVDISSVSDSVGGELGRYRKWVTELKIGKARLPKSRRVGRLTNMPASTSLGLRHSKITSVDNERVAWIISNYFCETMTVSL